MGRQYDTDPKDLIVGIGPHIARQDYEIQDDVVELFYGGFANNEEIIHTDKDGKHTLDLRKAIVSTLVQEGVLQDNIYYVDLSTFSKRIYSILIAVMGKKLALIQLSAL